MFFHQDIILSNLYQSYLTSKEAQIQKISEFRPGKKKTTTKELRKKSIKKMSKVERKRAGLICGYES